MTKWKHNDACLPCEAALLCMSGMIEPGTVVLLLAKEGDVEKYSVCLDYGLEDMHRGELPNYEKSRARAPIIIFDSCPRLSKIYGSLYGSHRLQGMPMNSPMEVML